MYTVKKICPLLGDQADHVDEIGEGATEAEAVELLRDYFLYANKILVELAKTTEIPECITNLAKKSIERNPNLNIVVREDGIVFIDGQGPEMDYYTITNDE